MLEKIMSELLKKKHKESQKLQSNNINKNTGPLQGIRMYDKQETVLISENKKKE